MIPLRRATIFAVLAAILASIVTGLVMHLREERQTGGDPPKEDPSDAPRQPSQPLIVKAGDEWLRPFDAGVEVYFTEPGNSYSRRFRYKTLDCPVGETPAVFPVQLRCQRGDPRLEAYMLGHEDNRRQWWSCIDRVNVEHRETGEGFVLRKSYHLLGVSPQRVRPWLFVLRKSALQDIGVLVPDFQIDPTCSEGDIPNECYLKVWSGGTELDYSLDRLAKLRPESIDEGLVIVQVRPEKVEVPAMGRILWLRHLPHLGLVPYKEWPKP